MMTHVIKYLPPRDKENHVLIMYDGHRSHVSLPLIQWARQNNIVLFVLPPHCSHLLQTHDVSCYGPFEVAWNAALHRHLRESGGSAVSRYGICKLACRVYTNTITPSNIQAAFKRCGVYPYNPDVIAPAVIAASMTFPANTETRNEKDSEKCKEPDEYRDSDLQDALERKGENDYDCHGLFDYIGLHSSE